MVFESQFTTDRQVMQRTGEKVPVVVPLELRELPPPLAPPGGRRTDDPQVDLQRLLDNAVGDNIYPRPQEILTRSGDGRVGERDTESETRPTVSEDLRTLTDPAATVAALERAGLRLVDRVAESPSYASEDARTAISGLRNVLESTGNSRRARREAQGLLLDAFDRLSDRGKGLANEEARERIARLGPTALNPLRRLIAANPHSNDANNPEGQKIRDNANLLIGGIEARENLHRVWQAFSEVRPDKAQPILNDMVASGRNLNDTRGLGTIRELRNFAESWRPGVDKRVASEKALGQIANELLRDGKALDDKSVRDRIRAIGPSAIDALQRVVQQNPPDSDRTNPDGRRLRELARELQNSIGNDVVRKETREAASAREHNHGEEVDAISRRLSTIGSDRNNPLASSVLRSLNDEYHNWRPGARQQFAQNILQQVTRNLLSEGQGLADPHTRSLLRDIGPVAMPALKEIMERNSEGNQPRNPAAERVARAARAVMDAIEADERRRTPIEAQTRPIP